MIAFWADHSIYAAFGGKRALLHQSLERYEKQGIRRIAAELARQDRATAARVRRSLERIEAAFREAFVRAQSRGEIEGSADTGAMARFLVASIQGLRLVGKANPDRAALEDIKRVMLCCLG